MNKRHVLSLLLYPGPGLKNTKIATKAVEFFKDKKNAFTDDEQKRIRENPKLKKIFASFNKTLCKPDNVHLSKSTLFN